MSRNKYGLRIQGEVRDIYIFDFMNALQEYTGENIGVLNGGGGLKRLVNSDVEGRVRGDWYEMMVECGEPNSFIPYTRTFPIRLDFKTTPRNKRRADETMEDIIRIVLDNGGSVFFYGEFER